MNIDNFLPIELEKKGLELFKSGNFKGAIPIFLELSKKYPNYEYGVAFLHLAYCFEDIGEFEKAKENYLIAIEHFPDELHRLGAYASFLYLHGTLPETIIAYSNLLTKYTSYTNYNEDEVGSIISILKELRKKST